MNDRKSMKYYSETCKSVVYLRAKLIVYDLDGISLSRHRTLKFNKPPNPITHSSDSITGTFYSHSLPEKSSSFKHTDVAERCCQFQRNSEDAGVQCNMFKWCYLRTDFSPKAVTVCCSFWCYTYRAYSYISYSDQQMHLIEYKLWQMLISHMFLHRGAIRRGVSDHRNTSSAW